MGTKAALFQPTFSPTSEIFFFFLPFILYTLSFSPRPRKRPYPERNRSLHEPICSLHKRYLLSPTNWGHLTNFNLCPRPSLAIESLVLDKPTGLRHDSDMEGRVNQAGSLQGSIAHQLSLLRFSVCLDNIKISKVSPILGVPNSGRGFLSLRGDAR